VVHQPVSRGLAVFVDAWLSDWLAEISADLRENGSALEVVLHDYAVYKSTFIHVYFTLLTYLRYKVQLPLLIIPTSEITAGGIKVTPRRPLAEKYICT